MTLPVNIENDPLLKQLRKTGILALGGVLLQRKIGEGAMGCIYSGLHTRLNIPVAVKVLKHFSGESFSSLLKEARLTVSIDHPNLVRIFDIDTDEASGLHYIVMEYVDGCSAYELLRKNLYAHGRPLNPSSALDVVLCAARALGATHEQGIVHRDVKSDNILIRRRDGAVKVSDLGLGCTLSLSHSRRRSCRTVGTLGFISPEVIAGQPATPASDVYALGTTLYELATGTLPYGPLDGHYQTAQLHDPPADPRIHLPGLDVRITQVILRCLSTQPSERYPDGAALAAALEKASAPASKNAAGSHLLKAVSAATVLVVDDDTQALDALRTVLAAKGCLPFCFSNPDAALAELPALQPDVAVLDMQLPHMNGLALARALRQADGCHDLPILILSANGQQSAMRAALKHGINDYLVKPAELGELLLRVQLLVKLRETNRQRSYLETKLLCARRLPPPSAPDVRART